MLNMKNTTRKKTTITAKIMVAKDVKSYINDPFFIKKRAMGAAFLEEVGLPESFTRDKEGRYGR